VEVHGKNAAARRQSRHVICAELKAADADDDETAGDCSWGTIIAAIRQHGALQPAEVKADLDEWADLLEGVAALHALRGG
jgi:hypothetical protein